MTRPRLRPTKACASALATSSFTMRPSGTAVLMLALQVPHLIRNLDAALGVAGGAEQTLGQGVIAGPLVFQRDRRANDVGR
jgi:hypothetical protein